MSFRFEIVLFVLIFSIVFEYVLSAFPFFVIYFFSIHLSKSSRDGTSPHRWEAPSSFTESFYDGYENPCFLFNMINGED